MVGGCDGLLSCSCGLAGGYSQPLYRVKHSGVLGTAIYHGTCQDAQRRADMRRDVQGRARTCSAAQERAAPRRNVQRRAGTRSAAQKRAKTRGAAQMLARGTTHDITASGSKKIKPTDGSKTIKPTDGSKTIKPTDGSKTIKPTDGSKTIPWNRCTRTIRRIEARGPTLSSRANG